MIQVRSEDLVTFTGVTKEFVLSSGSFTAIQQISLTVQRGDIVILLGPSGCGKSTLLNLTAGLVAPTRGQVLYGGCAIDGLNPNVAYMTQADHLFPWRTVAGNVAVPLEIAEVPRAERDNRVAELLALVGLTDFAASYPNQLSGGMRKRAALARLLAANREMLLLDEPFGALDAQLRLTLQAELLKVCRALNKTVLFVTHDIEEAAALADVCVVFQGRPGTIAKVVANPLPRERDLRQLRFDPQHHAFTNELWALLTPGVSAPTPAAAAVEEISQ
jgi:NitT/TauT family transport system ATP-binding protein